ncbi:uncharacterized protein DS421_18g626310 [Arachis hypogaea]|nr:uncharacterized protein DS421_18g626310 [Arachis hypogaea]
MEPLAGCCCCRNHRERGVARNHCCPASAILRFNIHWTGAASAFDSIEFQMLVSLQP